MKTIRTCQLLVLLLFYACTHEKKQETTGRVVVEQPAPVFVEDSTGGVVALEPEEKDLIEAEEPDTVQAPVVLPAPVAPIESIPFTPVVPKPPVPVVVNPNTPTVGISLNLNRLNNNLQAAGKGNIYFKRVVRRAIEVGNDALKRPILVLTTKPYQVVKVDKRYFMSVAPYWHPGKNGVWYRIDGKGNGLSGKIGDTEKIKTVTNTILDLALAWKASGNPVYAERAIQQLNAFLLDPNTGMLPNLEYAQIVPGNKEIRVEAMVEAPGLVKICDALILLKGSKSYSPAVEQAAKQWFASMLSWMTTSRMGKEADKRVLGNIGAIYELQLASYASFSGNEAFLKERWPEVTERLFRELDSRGAFTEELKRHKPNMYSNKALQAWVGVAKVYNQRGFNLWNLEQNGESLKEAGTFLVPYMMGEKKLTNGEKIEVNYALDTFRTFHYTYFKDEAARKEFERFLKKYDKALQAGNDTGALYEPFVKYW